MDLMGLEEIACITRSNYSHQILWSVSARRLNGSYEVIDRHAFGNSKQEATRYNSEGLAIMTSFMENYVSTVTSKLLISLDRNAGSKLAALREWKVHHGISPYPVDQFITIANNKNEVYIDRYLEDHPEFAHDLVNFCRTTLEMAINPSYAEELYIAASYILFGNSIVDYEWETTTFLCQRVLHILAKIEEGIEGQQDGESAHNYAFDQRLLPQIRENLKNDEGGFRERLTQLIESRAYGGEIMLSLRPNLYLLNLFDENGSWQSTYLEMPQLLRRENIVEFLTPFDIEPRSRNPIDINIVNSSEFFSQATMDDRFLENKIWLRLPRQKIGARKMREIFSIYNARRSQIWGISFDPKPNFYVEKQLITLIEYTGLHGVGRRTATEILDDQTLDQEDLSENAIAQIRRRAIQSNRLGTDFRLFIN